MRSLIWFRNDLRVADNPALLDAAQSGRAHACFIVCREQWLAHDVGEPRLAFLYRCLVALAEDLAALGVPFHLLECADFSAVPAVLEQLVRAHGISNIHFNAEYPWNERQRDLAVDALAYELGVEVVQHHGSVVLPPGSVLTQNESPFKVFTPFRRRWETIVSASSRQPLGSPSVQGEQLQPTPITGFEDIDPQLFATDYPGGERDAMRRLERFVGGAVERYADDRDFPALPGTSQLSAYLSVGAISPRQCLHAAQLARAGNPQQAGIDTWVSELVWREFYRHVTFLFPHVSRGQPFQVHTRNVMWQDNTDHLVAWQEGQTGYPLVDAAMRQLNTTGYMHNRLRMVAAMFLTKHLLLHWSYGERYFMQKLVDGDFAANNGGWQWSASTGTDAAPYFRVFNPASQGERFDRKGVFTRHWVPELEGVPNKFLYNPHAWPQDDLLSEPLSYPAPIVEHKFARQRAIDAFKQASR